MEERAAGTRATTAGPASINRTIWRLAWPQVLMLLTNVFIGMVDVYVAGRIDRNVQASLGMINQTLFFFLVVAGAVANGAVAAISQSIGAGRRLRAGRYVGLSLVLGLLLGTAVACAGYLVQGTFMDLLRVPAELRDVTGYFLKVYLLLLPIYSLFTITNAIFRAYARVIHPLYSMILVTVANGLATFGLGLGMFGLPNLGYQGVAWGTFLAVSLGCLYNLAVFRRLGLLAVSLLPSLRWSRRAMAYLFAVAWPSGLMQILWHSGYLVLFAITASLPRNNIVALAGMTAGLRIESLLFLVGFAFNMTASILVGHYLGAGRPDEARRYGNRILLIGVVSMSVLAAAMWPFLDTLAGLIAPEPAVRVAAVGYLRYNLAGIAFTLVNSTLAGAFIGAGASVYNLITFTLGAWCIRLPLAYVLGHLVYGEAEGVWMAMLASMAAQAGMMLYLWRFKDWSRFAMRRPGRRNGLGQSAGPRPSEAGVSESAR